MIYSRAFLFLMLALASTPLGGQPLDESSGIATVNFRSGNRLSAEIVTETSDGKRDFVVLKTESGGLLKLDKAKLIQSIVPFGREQQEYAARIAQLAQTPEGHWQMYEWTKSDGRRLAFQQENRFHLKRIVELDPSDSKAWQLLGYIEIAGRWVPEEQHYVSQGYVKSGGKWIPKIQVDVDRKKTSREQFQNDRKIALKKWKKNVLPSAEPDVVRSELFKIVDPVSVDFFVDNYLKKESEPKLRMLYLEAIGLVASPSAQQVLVECGMKDSDRDVREAAMTQLEQEHFNPDVSVSLLVRYLGSTRNELVNRAGRWIGRLNRNSGIIPLIGSLETKHKMQTGNDPGRITTGFDSNGGTGLSTGGAPTVIETRSNEDVLRALEQITGQRFGFDANRWKEWYISQHTITEFDFRRDSEN